MNSPHLPQNTTMFQNLQLVTLEFLEKKSILCSMVEHMLKENPQR